MSTGALPGFRDFYPAECAERSFIMAAWRAVARRYAFVEYDGPPLEPLELYTRKSGEEIVGQLYHFVDKGGRDVALRPEMTPTFARMVAARANAMRKPVRWFTLPQLFRYERQQKGRLREHFQLNIDIVGEADVTADAELLAVAIDIMRQLGLTSADVQARVSDRRLLQALLMERGLAPEQLPAAFGVIDKLERQPRDVSLAKLRALSLSEATAAEVIDLVGKDLDTVAASLKSPDARALIDQMRTYIGYLTALLGEDASRWVRFDLSIVRGLAYYTGIVFELFDAKGEHRAICGGGRYDTLLQSLGGVDLPALGFGMGDVVLGDLVRERGRMPVMAPAIDCWVGATEDRLLREVMVLVGELRARGWSVEYALRPQSLAKQFKAAGAAGAHRIAILSAESLAAGTVSVRSHDDPKDTPPKTVTREELLGMVRE
jgi:histidyl-tRNA synthetase